METLLLSRDARSIEERSVGARHGVKGRLPAVMTLRADLAVRAGRAFDTEVAGRTRSADLCLTWVIKREHGTGIGSEKCNVYQK